MPLTSSGSRDISILYRLTVIRHFYERAFKKSRNFQRDSDDPEKVERYQAEAMVRGQVPIHALLGVVCYTEHAQEELLTQVDRLGIGLNIHCLPHWYF